MKFSIDGKIYDGVDVQHLTMRDMLVFSQEVKELGRDITWDDVTRWHDEMAAMETDAERHSHPEAIWLTATGIWAARRAAGEKVTFAEAIDIRVDSIKYLPDAQDHRPKAPAGKARKPRAGSAQGAKRPAKAGAVSTPSADG